LWPGSSLHAQKALEEPRYEDYEYVRKSPTEENMLAWLGNGLTMAQVENGNTSAYLDTVDVPPILNHRPRNLDTKAAKTDGHVNGYSKELGSVAKAAGTMTQ
jgi:hypothetical protein